VDVLLHDLRGAIRALRKSKGVSLIAVATLGIGIAVVTTIFSLVNSALFRPPPYPDAHRMVAVSEQRPGVVSQFSELSLESVRELRRGAPSIDRVGIHGRRSVTLSGVEQTTELTATTVDTAVLPLLGVRPQRGRLPTSDEIERLDPVAFISDRVWHRHFGASEAIVGQTIRLEGLSYTVVGVAPPGFGFPTHSQLWLPLDERPGPGHPVGDPSFSALVRLRAGASRAQLRADLRLISERLTGSGLPHLSQTSLVAREGMVDRNSRIATVAATFLGGAVFVLLIACTNIGNLLLARATERRTEMALRASLGASRWRLVRQALTESLVLGAAAGIVGLLLTVWAIAIITGLELTANLPSWVRLGIDPRVLVFTVGLSLVAVIAFGLGPALAGSRVDTMHALKAGVKTASRGKGVMRSARRGVVIEMALAVSLFIGAFLLWQTYRSLSAIDPGFDAERVLITGVAFDQAKHPDGPSRLRLLADVEARLISHPAVEQVATRGGASGQLLTAVAERDTMGGSQPVRRDVRIYLPESPDTPVDDYPAPRIWTEAVADDYFATLGIPIVRGRGFDAGDGAGTAPVVIMSEELARGLWAEQNALGRQIRIGRDPGTSFTVIGVTRDIRFTTSSARGMDAGPKRMLYYSNRQVASLTPELVIRVRGDAASLIPTLLAALRATDPEVAPRAPETMAEQTGNELGTQVAGAFMGTFALAALALAALGIYGVLAYGVADRTREIGIRIALGGTARDVIRLVVGDGMRSVAIGLAIGLVLALGMTPLLRRFIWGVSAYDPRVFAAVIGVFGAVALLACWIPARRATRVQPMVALRQE
jgi:predicted permease